MMVSRDRVDVSIPTRIARLALPAGAVLALLGAAALASGGQGAGLLEAEARNGLLARVAAGHGGALFDPTAGGSPLVAALVALFGRAVGFGSLSLRLASLAAGLGAAGFTALWLRRIFGPPWGAAALLVLGGSAPLLVFSQLALSPAAGALALAATLWLLSEGAAGRAPFPTLLCYAAAGVAAGLGFLSDPPLRLLPLLLLAVVALALTLAALSHDGRNPAALGSLLALLTCDLVLAPGLPALANSGSLGFWVPTAGLPGATVSSPGALAHGYLAALERLVWPARDALFGPPLWPWLLLGVLVAARRLHRPAVALGALSALALLLPAALVAPPQSGRLLAALPLVSVLPLAGMRAAVHYPFSRSPWPRRLLAGLVVLSLTGNLALTVAAGPHPPQPDASTERALALANRLLGSEPVLFSTSGHDDVVRYLAAPESGSAGRLDFDGGALLPIPLERSGYLVAPAATPLDPALAALVAPFVIPSLSNADATVYRIDDRARLALPASLPTAGYVDGSEFRGSELLPRGRDGTALSVLLTWRLPGDGLGRWLRVRLSPTDAGRPAQVVTVPLPGFAEPTDVVRLVVFKAPPAGTQADLSVTLLDGAGDILGGDITGSDGALFLNRYDFTR